MSIRKASNLLASTQIAGGGGGAAAGGAESNVWAAPETPHAANDEFDGADMSGWSVQNVSNPAAGSISLNTVNAYDTTFNSGNAVRVSLDQRPSWALIQAPASSEGFMIYESITAPTNLLVTMRAKIATPINVANDDSVVGLRFGLLTAGVPNQNNFVSATMSAPYQNQNRAVVAYHPPSGGGTGTVVDGYITDSLPYSHEYVAIHKLDTTYHVWLGTGQGAWVWYASYSSIPFTPDFIGIIVQNTSTAAPGVSVVGVDYVRCYETANFIL